MRDHGLEPCFSKLSFIAGAFIFGSLDSGVKIEGVPGDFELRVRVRSFVCRDRFLETALADETPGTDLLSVCIWVIYIEGILCRRRCQWRICLPFVLSRSGLQL